MDVELIDYYLCSIPITHIYSLINLKIMAQNSPNEGKVTKAIEKQTAKVPSIIYLTAAFASMAGSLTLKLMGHKSQALFVGQWAAPFLILGIYNKIVKTEGHD